MGSTDEKINIVILGGGISGLALGAGLAKKPHITFTIYESVPEYKDVGAGLALHLNAIKAMTLIDDEVRKAYVDRALDMGEEDMEMATQVILAHGPNSGEVVAELGKAKGRKTIARYELMKGIMELLPKGAVKFGKRAESIRETNQGVVVKFTDGEEATADCVIGSDGVHSITRSYILGPDHPAVEAKNHDGYQNYRRMLPMDKAREYGLNEQWTKFVPIMCGPKGNINSMPLDRGQRLSIGLARRGLRWEADKYSGAPPLKPEEYTDYSEEAQMMIRMIADDVSGSWSYADHDHAPVYYRGRVCMIGDAAHCMHPFAGNGAAQALEDCAVIDHLFSKVHDVSQIEKAFAAYDTTRRPRSQAVVEISRKYGRVYGYAEGNMHEDPEQMRAFFKESAAFTNNADLTKQNQDAMDLYLAN
ncbi:hypothetical protein DOTSEDRAFT_80005 [Lecanosticta acicola]|uniref:FAD-binding domain-containing protein n=1 Tax=Lecanosticta acicola TaxID=111012 RepID=A0AAI8YZJ7_9PEZI|nr:hypothetical protein DOTSEDRAFT_80005 [Lecanosticta acicola]